MNNFVRCNPATLARYRQRGLDDHVGRPIEQIFDDMLNPFGSSEGEARREGDYVLHAGRSASRFMRSVVLPAEVEDGGARTHMNNGILTLTLPGKQGSEATPMTIR